MTGRRTAVGLAAVIVVVAMLASGCVLSGTWTVANPVDPSPPTTATALNDVSCTSATHCMAVGQDATPAGGLDRVPLVERWDGGTWSVVPPPTGFPAGTNQASLTSVACTAPTACAATAYTRIGTAYSSRFVRWDGTAWHELGPVGNGTAGSVVACPASGGCVLAAQSAGTAVWNGTSATTVATPTPQLLALSCGSVDLCFGVGYDDSVHRWDGATWTTVVVPMNSQAFSVGYYDVTCTSDEHCLLVGRSWDPYPSPNVYPEAARWDGTTWTATPVPAGIEVLTTVACASPTGCVAIGISAGAGPPPLVAIGWNGGSWYAAPAPPVNANVDAFDYYGTEISCSPDERCMTVNSAYVGAVPTPFGASYDWSAA
jgi:hypothetical protein